MLLLVKYRLQFGTGSGGLAVTVTGAKADADPKIRDDDASSRGTNFRLRARWIRKQLLSCEQSRQHYYLRTYSCLMIMTTYALRQSSISWHGEDIYWILDLASRIA